MPDAGLRTFHCRVRAGGRTLTLDCMAPSPLAAAYAIARAVESTAPWVQVVASEWSVLLREFVDPPNAIVIAADEPRTAGIDRVVFIPPSD